MIFFVYILKTPGLVLTRNPGHRDLNHFRVRLTCFFGVSLTLLTQSYWPHLTRIWVIFDQGDFTVNCFKSGLWGIQFNTCYVERGEVCTFQLDHNM